MLDCGIIPIVCTISPTEPLRAIARKIISSHNLIEVYISTPIVECERRDVKGLYSAAREGKVTNFTGVSAPFEPPQHAHIEIDTTDKSITECANIIFQTIKPRIVYEL
jgi:adenylylsulfate kinase-like enzyme